MYTTQWWWCNCLDAIADVGGLVLSVAVGNGAVTFMWFSSSGWLGRLLVVGEDGRGC